MAEAEVVLQNNTRNDEEVKENNENESVKMAVRTRASTSTSSSRSLKKTKRSRSSKKDELVTLESRFTAFENRFDKFLDFFLWPYKS